MKFRAACQNHQGEKSAVKRLFQEHKRVVMRLGFEPRPFYDDGRGDAIRILTNTFAINTTLLRPVSTTSVEKSILCLFY